MTKVDGIFKDAQVISDGQLKKRKSMINVQGSKPAKREM